MTQPAETPRGNERPPAPAEIAARLRALSDEMYGISVLLDYYGGFSEWARHGREMAGAGAIARQWAAEIENSGPIDTPRGGR